MSFSEIHDTRVKISNFFYMALLHNREKRQAILRNFRQQSLEDKSSKSKKVTQEICCPKISRAIVPYFKLVLKRLPLIQIKNCESLLQQFHGRTEFETNTFYVTQKPIGNLQSRQTIKSLRRNKARPPSKPWTSIRLR